MAVERPNTKSNPPTTGAEINSVMVDLAGSQIHPVIRETLRRMSSESDGDWTPDFASTRKSVAAELGYDDDDF